MKLAVAGKGGVGKTSFTAWLADYLVRSGHEVWLVDADTALSLGVAMGLASEEIPTPLIADEKLIRERVGAGGMLRLNPNVDDLPQRLVTSVAGANLLVMGSVAGAGGGCACGPNSLLKSLLAHLVLDRGKQWVLVDLEAGVEHLGRGTVSAVDGLVIVGEPSRRSLETGASISRMARDLGLTNHVLVLNRTPDDVRLPAMDGLPPLAATIPVLPSLVSRQLTDGSVLGLEEREDIDLRLDQVLAALAVGFGSDDTLSH
ncbi:MAG: AAA family ATPase [Desulfovibrionaceae bacterium]|nr:AAA family ATPase [Desulfovibrionaceae bacterium]